MKILTVLLMFLHLNACSVRRNSPSNDKLTSHQTPSTTPVKQDTISSFQNPPVPMTSVPVPAPLTSTQGANIEMDFASLSFLEISGFDIPMITITIPSDSTLTSDQFKVQFSACPTDPIDSTLTGALNSCVTGYNRKLQFEIPIFTQNFHLKLQLCDDTQCYNTTEKDISSTRYLGPTPSATDLKIANALLQEEISLQNALANIHSVYLKVQNLSTYANSCPNNLSAQDKSNIQILSSMTETNLDDMFLDPPASNFINFLSQDFVTKTAPAIQQNMPAEVNKTVKTVQEYFDSAFLIITTGAAAVWVFQDKVERLRWNEYKINKRTLSNLTKTVFVKDKQTGFLISIADSAKTPCLENGINIKNCTFYMEDPQTKELLKSPHGGLLTIDPIEMGIKYENDHFYRYNYTENKYSFENAQGQARSRWNPSSYYEEIGLKRDKDNKVLLTKDLSNPEQISEYFETRESLYKNKGMRMQTYLDKSNSVRPDLFKARITLSDIPETVRSNVKPLLIFTGVIASQIGTIVNLVQTVQQKTTNLADTTNPICSSGVSLKKDISNIADNRAAMSMLELQVETLLGYPFTIIPKTSLKAN